MALTQRQHPFLPRSRHPVLPPPSLGGCSSSSPTPCVPGHRPCRPALHFQHFSIHLLVRPKHFPSDSCLSDMPIALGFQTRLASASAQAPSSLTVPPWVATKPFPLSSLPTADPFKHQRKRGQEFFKNKGYKLSLLTQIHLEVGGVLQNKSSTLQLSLPPDGERCSLAPEWAKS